MVTEEDVEDFVLSRHHGLRKSIEDAGREYRKRGGVPLAEVVRRLTEANAIEARKDPRTAAHAELIAIVRALAAPPAAVPGR